MVTATTPAAQRWAEALASRRRAREALAAGGDVLDVGVGGGAASLRHAVTVWWDTA